MTIYIDNDFKCHAQNDGTMREVETEFFDGRCPAFIEGYRYVPDGEKWVLPNGTFFHGEMIAPWRDYNILEAVQAAYEQGQDNILTAVETALGVTK